jgi:hypothetical protein
MKPSIRSQQFYALIVKHQDDDDRLLWFGDFTADKSRSAQTKLGRSINEFQGRFLAGGIRLILDVSMKKSQQWQLRFTKKP